MEPNNYRYYSSQQNINHLFPQEIDTQLNETSKLQPFNSTIGGEEEELLHLLDNISIAYLIEQDVLDPYTLNFTDNCQFPPLLPFDKKCYPKQFHELESILKSSFECSFSSLEDGLKAENLNLALLLRTALNQCIKSSLSSNPSISLIGGTVRTLLRPWFYDNLKNFWTANGLDKEYLPLQQVEESIADIDFRICLPKNAKVEDVRSIQWSLTSKILQHAQVDIRRINPGNIAELKTFARVIKRNHSPEHQYTVTTLSFCDSLGREIDFAVVSDLENERLFELDRFKLLLTFKHDSNKSYLFDSAIINFKDEYQDSISNMTQAWVSIFHNCLKINKVSSIQNANYAVWARWLTKRVQGYCSPLNDTIHIQAYDAVSRQYNIFPSSVVVEELLINAAFTDKKPLIERLILTCEHHIPHVLYAKEALILQAYASLYRVKGLQEAKAFIKTVAEAETKTVDLTNARKTFYINRLQYHLLNEPDEKRATDKANNDTETWLKKFFKLELTPSIFTDFIHLLTREDIPLEIIHAYIELVCLGHINGYLMSEVSLKASYTWKLTLDKAYVHFPFQLSYHVEELIKFCQVKDNLVKSLDMFVKLHEHIFTQAHSFEDKLSCGLISENSIHLLVKTLAKVCKNASQDEAMAEYIQSIKELMLYFFLILQKINPTDTQVVKILSLIPSILQHTVYQNVWKNLFQNSNITSFLGVNAAKFLYLTEAPEVSFLDWAMLLQNLSLKKACKLARANIQAQDHLKGYAFLKQVMQKDFAEGIGLFLDWKKYFSKSEVEEILSDIDQELQVNQRLSHSASKEQLLKELTVYLKELIQHQLSKNLKTLPKKIAYILYHIYTFNPQPELVSLICNALKVTPFNPAEKTLLWQKLCESEMNCAINGHFQLIALWFKGSHEKVWSKDFFKEGAGHVFLDKILQALGHPQIQADTLKKFFKEFENYSVSEKTKERMQQILESKLFNDEDNSEPNLQAYQEELLKYVSEETRFRYDWKKIEGLFAVDLNQALTQLRERMDLALKYDKLAFVNSVVLFQQELIHVNGVKFNSLVYTFSNFLLHDKVKKAFESQQELWLACFYALAERLNTFDFLQIDQLKLVKDVTSHVLRAIRESSSANLEEAKIQLLIQLISRLLQHLSLDPNQDKKLKEQIAAFSVWLFNSQDQLKVKVLLELMENLLQRCIPISFSDKERKIFIKSLNQAISDMALQNKVDSLLKNLKLHEKYKTDTDVKNLYLSFTTQLASQLSYASTLTFYHWSKVTFQIAASSKEPIALPILEKWADAADEKSFDEKFWILMAGQLPLHFSRNICKEQEVYNSIANLTINALLRIVKEQKTSFIELYQQILALMSKSTRPNAIILTDMLQHMFNCEQVRGEVLQKKASVIKLLQAMFKLNLSQTLSNKEEIEPILEFFQSFFEHLKYYTLHHVLTNAQLKVFFDWLDQSRQYQFNLPDSFKETLKAFSKYLRLVDYDLGVKNALDEFYENYVIFLSQYQEDTRGWCGYLNVSKCLYNLKNPKGDFDLKRKLLEQLKDFVCENLVREKAFIEFVNVDWINEDLTDFYLDLLLQVMFGSPTGEYLQIPEFWDILELVKQSSAIDAAKIINYFVLEEIGLSSESLLIATKFADSYINSKNFDEYEDEGENAYQSLRKFIGKILQQIQAKTLSFNSIESACLQFDKYAVQYHLSILDLCLHPLNRRFVSAPDVLNYALEIVDHEFLVNSQDSRYQKILKIYLDLIHDYPKDNAVTKYLPSMISLLITRALEKNKESELLVDYAKIMKRLGFFQEDLKKFCEVWKLNYQDYAQGLLHHHEQFELSTKQYNFAVLTFRQWSIHVNSIKPNEKLKSFIIHSLTALNEKRLNDDYPQRRLLTYLVRFNLDLLFQHFPEAIEDEFKLIQRTLILFEFDANHIQQLVASDYIKGLEWKLPKTGLSAYISLAFKWMRINRDVAQELKLLDYLTHISHVEALIDEYLVIKSPYLLNRAYEIFYEMLYSIYTQGTEQQKQEIEPRLKVIFSKLNTTLLSLAWHDIVIGEEILPVYKHMTTLPELVCKTCSIEFIKSNLNTLVLLYNQTKAPPPGHPFVNLHAYYATNKRLELFVHFMQRIGTYWINGLFKDHYLWIRDYINQWINFFVTDMKIGAKGSTPALAYTEDAAKLVLTYLIQEPSSVDSKYQPDWKSYLLRWIDKLLIKFEHEPDVAQNLQNFALALMHKKGLLTTTHSINAKK